MNFALDPVSEPLFRFVYNSLGVPIAAGVLYPFFGRLLSSMIAAAAVNRLSSRGELGYQAAANRVIKPR